MASERMMQAIARMEKALDALEAYAAAPNAPEVHTPPSLPQAMNDDSRARAVQALKSLDSLIAEIKTRG